MGFLRAISAGRWRKARELASSSSLLAKHTELQHHAQVDFEALHEIKEMVGQLYQDEALSGMRDLYGSAKYKTMNQIAVTRGHIARKLQRLKPGATSALEASVGGDGNVLAQPRGMVQKLSIDGLPRRMRREVPKAVVRMFAGIALSNVSEQADKVQEVFEELITQVHRSAI